MPPLGQALGDLTHDFLRAADRGRVELDGVQDAQAIGHDGLNASLPRVREDERRVALIVTPRYPPLLGGMERECALLAEEFARRGFEPLVVTEQLGEQLSRDEIVDGIRVLRVPSSPNRSLGVQLRVAAAVGWIVLRHRRRAAFAVVRTITLPAVVVGLLKRLRLIGFPTLATAEIGGRNDDVVALAERPLFSLSRSLVSAHDRLNGICAANVAHLHEHGFPAERITDVPNGIDTSPWEHAEPPARVRRLLFLGRLDPAKGLFELLEAFDRVHDGHPDVTLDIAGDGPARTELERIAGPAVRFHGQLAHAEAMALLDRSDALVLPSYSEGMPLSVLEAAARRRALILTDVGDAHTLFHGAAYFCAPRDAGDLARAIDEAVRAEAPRGDYAAVVGATDIRAVAGRMLAELNVEERRR
jgi:glycosyltransferase involved in cell wall biosynthesis